MFLCLACCAYARRRPTEELQADEKAAEHGIALPV